MSNFHSICNNATNPCYLLQTRLVVTHKYYTNLPLADHLIHYTTESKAPCSNPKGRLRTTEQKERHLSSIIIKPATQIGTVNPKICYTNSLFIPPMEVSMLRSLCNRIKPDFCTTPTMVCDQILCAPRKCFREGLIYTAGHRFRSPSAQRP